MRPAGAAARSRVRLPTDLNSEKEAQAISSHAAEMLSQGACLFREKRRGRARDRSGLARKHKHQEQRGGRDGLDGYKSCHSNHCRHYRWTRCRDGLERTQLRSAWAYSSRAAGGAVSGYFLQTIVGIVVTSTGEVQQDSDLVTRWILQGLAGLVAGAIFTLAVGFLKHSIDQHRMGKL